MITFLFPVLILAYSTPEGPAPDQRPAYAQVYDAIIAHVEAGQEVEALRLFPRLYAQEIPVDAFYTSLEKTRLEILNDLIARESFQSGDQTNSAESITRLCNHLFTRRPWVYRHHVDVTHQLSFHRLMFFFVVHDEIIDSVLSSRISKKKAGGIRELIFSSDPWEVSVALFLLGHADQGFISPQDIVKRWYDRPDLWDETCTDQALLALASHEPSAISPLQAIFPSLTESLARLRTIDSKSSLVQTVIYGERDLSFLSWSPKATLIFMKKKTGDPGTIKRWSGDANQASTHEEASRRDFPSQDVQKIQPGAYRISVRAQMCWGDSLVFEAPVGRFVRIFIGFQCGV